MRGNAIFRILAVHPEVYWDKKFHANRDPAYPSPLDIPSNITSIVGLAANDIADKIGMWKMGYATHHTASLVDGQIWKKVFTNWMFNSYNNSLILFGIANPSATVDEKLFKLIDTNKPHIWVYGTLNRLNMQPTYYAPSTNPLAYNLNVDNLFSTDYITFETEYYALIANFNLTSCLNKVRAFILLLLEREQYISKFY